MSYMLIENDELIAREWEKYSGYTIRPVQSTVSFYESVIKNTESESVNLMFGATPEIRSIFQRMGRKLLLVDRSLAMVSAMGRLTAHQRPVADNETVMHLDWADINSLDKKFDFMIGDDAINMIEWAQFDKFLNDAATLLNPGGMFVCHLLVKPDDHLIERTAEEVFSDYERGIIKSRYDLASMLNFICYDKQTWCMGWQQTIQRIGREFLKDKSGLFDFMGLFNWCNSCFCCPPQLAFEAQIQRYFDIDDCIHPHEHDYCRFEPVYVLSKKRG